MAEDLQTLSFFGQLKLAFHVLQLTAPLWRERQMLPGARGVRSRVLCLSSTSDVPKHFPVGGRPRIRLCKPWGEATSDTAAEAHACHHSWLLPVQAFWHESQRPALIPLHIITLEASNTSLQQVRTVLLLSTPCNDSGRHLIV
jgi:hypothetical protein